MIKKLIPKFLGGAVILMSLLTVALMIYKSDLEKDNKKFDHKYVAGDCIEFNMYDWDFYRNSAGETFGEARVEYVRYATNGAYYGLRLIDDINHVDKPTFKYPKSPRAIAVVLSKNIDNIVGMGPFSFTDYIPGSKVITIRNGMTCRHGWKDE